MAVIGVKALEALNRGKFELRTREDLDDLKLGKHARKIAEYASVGPIDKPVRVENIARNVGLSKKQAYMALECMVDRRDPVFAKFKDQDVIEYLRTPPRAGWLHEALQDLTVAIDELGQKMPSYGKTSWNYVPLIEKNGMPIYSSMQLNFLRGI
ncbi:MAG: hypothetical protein NT016_02785 [Candidatus Aenigmarchaeota archaeon]|nr:hypothetical protein [Candidatus Aenigmarchaeota archaeon]